MVALLKMPAAQTESAAPHYSGRFADSDPAERRMFPRKPVRMDVAGVRIDHTLPARRQPKLQLTLRDLSMGGMSAISDMPLACGERLSIVFPANNRLGGWDAFGRVIRCDASSMGYRLAVAFENLPAA